ncbi:hypothetical protein TRFO_15996 [Tritrichomonas foetus]|uniref:EF-hand domain-containing protein n=1 Tax=Tritrichomonas foetus TaxID=1144522 RepID=A0A1J4KRQ6_9EUKA|nr:hypothetical protein TRFO_15996 [Tritrichomonas foetus]|eukprot:OHT13778.1 hypothetical protein TRFO_15996 [Tritrichomonas foetus]
MPLTASELKVIRKLYDRFDIDKSGEITPDEFGDFIKTALKIDLTAYSGDEELPSDLEKADLPDDEIEWLLNGIDINNDKKASFNEVIKCFAAIKDQDMLHLSMISFRGLDKKRNRIIKLKDVKDNNVGVIGGKLTRDEFISKMQETLGEVKNTINFSEYFRILTGGVIQYDYDPYEGEIGQTIRSAYCILI